MWEGGDGRGVGKHDGRCGWLGDAPHHFLGIGGRLAQFVVECEECACAHMTLVVTGGTGMPSIVALWQICICSVGGVQR